MQYYDPSLLGELIDDYAFEFEVSYGNSKAEDRIRKEIEEEYGNKSLARDVIEALKDGHYEESTKMNKFTEAKSSAEKLYNTLFKMRETMQEVANMAQELADDASEYGGEISRVVREQCISYLIPAIKKIVSDEGTPGAIEPIIVFLDSCPLSFIREEPDAPQGPQPVAPNGAILATPVGSIPQNASYQKMRDEGPIEEPVEEFQPNPDAFSEAEIRAFKKAHLAEKNAEAFFGNLFQEKETVKLPFDLGASEKITEANPFTASGRAVNALNKVQKVNQKALAKVQAITSKWDINKPQSWWRTLPDYSKRELFDQAKQEYVDAFVQSGGKVGVNYDQAFEQQFDDVLAKAADSTQKGMIRPSVGKAVLSAYDKEQGSNYASQAKYVQNASFVKKAFGYLKDKNTALKMANSALASTEAQAGMQQAANSLS